MCLLNWLYKPQHLPSRDSLAVRVSASAHQLPQDPCWGLTGLPSPSGWPSLCALLWQSWLTGNLAHLAQGSPGYKTGDKNPVHLLHTVNLKNCCSRIGSSSVRNFQACSQPSRLKLSTRMCIRIHTYRGAVQTVGSGGRQGQGGLGSAPCWLCCWGWVNYNFWCSALLLIKWREMVPTPHKAILGIKQRTNVKCLAQSKCEMLVWIKYVSTSFTPICRGYNLRPIPKNFVLWNTYIPKTCLNKFHNSNILYILEKLII